MLSADRAEAAMARLSMVYDETGRELYMGAGRGCYGPASAYNLIVAVPALLGPQRRHLA
jgi:hypothetical protein